MLRVAFVIIPDRLNHKPFKNHQLTASYLLTILEKTFRDTVSLSIIDLRGISDDDVKYYLPEMDVYCYTAFSSHYRSICEIRDILRPIYPNAKHIVGGPHVDIFPEEITGFDAISIGEGEKNIINIIKDIMEGKLKGVYKNAELISLDDYPYPLRKYQPYHSVVDTGFFDADNAQLRAANVLFSRGCPFRCHFCANLNQGPIRYRNPELIVEEIEYLKKKYNVQALVLRDDNAIPVNSMIAEPFLKAIGRTGVKWRGQSRANGISEKMVALAAETGCLDLALGIESASPQVLKIINKKMDLDEAKKYIKILKKYKIGVKLLLVLGLPGEPDDVVSQTLNFIEETGPKIVALALLCPFPGSEITRRYKDFGIKKLNPNYHEYFILHGRFDKGEKPRLMFEYEEVTPWGKGKSTEKILEDYNKLQDILRERGLNF